METMRTLGDITQGHGAGLELKAKAITSVSVNAGALFANAMNKSSTKQAVATFDANNISSLHIGKTQGLLSKWVESESIPVADVKEIKKINETDNDVYFQFTFSNGEISVVKSLKNLKNGTVIEHPASTITECFISKFVQ